MPRNQANFKVRVAARLAERGMTVTELARLIRKSRSKTSQAIHHGGYRIIERDIKKTLSIK